MEFVRVTDGCLAGWSTETEDLDATLVSWASGGGVQAHVNDEVDVVMTVLTGAGWVRVGSERLTVEPGTVVIIPKTMEREILAADGGLIYLNVHKRRRGLMPRPGGRP